ncbi:MAG TPA: metal-dependent hydrolase [Bacteroidota bacterium]|nr:metal-dependent hydrolase [Bacteroidota bacterium]
MPSRSIRTSRLAVTWLGHSAFKFETPGGRVVLIDPWLENPKAPPGAKKIRRVDLILVTHAHGDHLGNTVDIARRTGAKIACIFDLSVYLASKGVDNILGMNKGGTISVDGLNITMVDAKHSSDIDAGGMLSPGGEAAGYIIEFENGLKVYHAGDTSVFGDMKIIAEIYKPEVAILPIGDHFTMGPREAAYACKLLKPKKIIGMHYGTFPVLTGTPAELKRLLPPQTRKRVLELEPGKTVML